MDKHSKHFRHIKRYIIMTFSNVSPNDQELISFIKCEHPNEVLVQGHLVRMGVRVNRKLLENLHHMDHNNITS